MKSFTGWVRPILRVPRLDQHHGGPPILAHDGVEVTNILSGHFASTLTRSTIVKPNYFDQDTTEFSYRRAKANAIGMTKISLRPLQGLAVAPPQGLQNADSFQSCGNYQWLFP